MRKNPPSFATLLATLIIALIVIPIFNTTDSQLPFEMLLALVLIACVATAKPSKRRTHFAVLTVVAISLRWLNLYQSDVGFTVLSGLTTLVWIVFALRLIIEALWSQESVSADTIFGAVVVYLFSALAFAIIYRIIDALVPGSLKILDSSLHEAGTYPYVYFSMVTIATVGYGDVLPLSNAARAFATLEGMFGQIYLGVVVARIVGLHVAAREKKQ